MKYEAPLLKATEAYLGDFKDYLLENSSVLEIASGGDEHASCFCQLNKNISGNLQTKI